jgi:hypothetical protein
MPGRGVHVPELVLEAETFGCGFDLAELLGIAGWLGTLATGLIRGVGMVGELCAKDVVAAGAPTILGIGVRSSAASRPKRLRNQGLSYGTHEPPEGEKGGVVRTCPGPPPGQQ